MKETVLQINESTINESFEVTNNVFDSFRILSSELFLYIFEWITPISENLLK